MMKPSTSFLLILMVMSLTLIIQIMDRKKGGKVVQHLVNSKDDSMIPPVQDSLEDHKIATTEITKPKRIFKILYWTIDNKIVTEINWFGLGSKPFVRCEYKDCMTTNNKNEYNSSDAILVKMRLEDSLPSYRFPWQKWITRWHESPANGNYTRYNNVFNATWTYSTRADIFSHQYMRKFVPLPVIGGKVKYQPPHADFFKNKTKMAAWFVSHCRVQSRREELVKGLQTYLDVDIYGFCGPLKCGQRMDKDCDKILSSDYKFYLSFENSLCDQYVTEKLWRAYDNDIIPVVLGASNYSSFLPEHSYIDIGRFESVQHLADYMIMVSRNEEKYMEYFEWKKKYRIESFGGNACQVCKYMHETANRTKIYDRLDKYWDKSKDCVLPEVFYKNLFPGNVRQASIE